MFLRVFFAIISQAIPLKGWSDFISTALIERYSAPSSSGLGPNVFSVVIRGSNPLGVTGKNLRLLSGIFCI